MSKSYTQEKGQNIFTWRYADRETHFYCEIVDRFYVSEKHDSELSYSVSRGCRFVDD